MQQWYESTQGGLFGHAAVPSGVSRVWTTMFAGRAGKSLDPQLVSRIRDSVGVRSEELEPGGASEVARDVCDTARRDRDGGYPCS